MSELTEPADGGEIGGDAAVSPGFSVELEVYSGPFDALLSMIANRRLELTEVSLSEITEEFLAYVRTLDLARDMEEASAFLDVSSVLVEAKSAALLPHDQTDGERDEQSLEALRERDLLFARLLQYRAFKQAAGDFRARLAANAGSSRIRHMSMNVSRRCCRSLHGRWVQRTWRASPHRCSPTRRPARCRCISCMCRLSTACAGGGRARPVAALPAAVR